MKYPDFTEASCVGIGMELFFPVPHDDEDESKARFIDVDAVKKVCASCPVLEQCAEWAIHHEKWGIWGGLTPQERNKIRKQRNIFVEDPITMIG